MEGGEDAVLPRSSDAYTSLKHIAAASETMSLRKKDLEAQLEDVQKRLANTRKELSDAVGSIAQLQVCRMAYISIYIHTCMEAQLKDVLKRFANTRTELSDAVGSIAQLQVCRMHT